MVCAMARVSVSCTGASVDNEPAGKLAHIDVLRGIAILAVIICHHGLEFSQLEGLRWLSAVGRLGVQLFFVASAVTLCRSAMHRAGEPRRWSSFFVRRLFRIAPLYYLALIFYALVRGTAPGIVPDGELPGLYAPVNVLANLLFVHGFLPGAYNDVVPGGWSIAAEMAFYLMFPALFVGATKVERRGGLRALALVTVGMWLLCLGGQVAIFFATGVTPDEPFVYSSIINQLPVFMVGMIAFFAVEREGARAIPDASALFVLTGAPTVLLLLCPIPLADQFVPMLAAVSFVFLLSAVRTRLTRGGLLAEIGRRSYSIYIVHFAVVWLAGGIVDTLAAESARVQLALYLPTLLGAVAVSFAVAGATGRIIERPFIALGERWISRRRLADRGCIARTPLYGSALP